MRSGEEYLRDLNDGRNVIYDGAQVANVTGHAALAGAARTVAHIIDRHSAADAADLRHQADSVPDFPTGYLLPTRESDIRKRGAAFRHVAAISGGFMARTPDFLASLLASWRAARAAFGSYAGNVTQYYEMSRDNFLVHSHAISDLSTVAGADAAQAYAANLRKLSGDSAGIIVRGVKKLATLAPYADELLVYPFRPLANNEGDQALAFSVPMNAAGLRIVCRKGLADGACPSINPLAARFDEMDALCVFEDVFVPSERIFIDGDVGLCNSLRDATNMTSFLWHQTAARCYVQSEFFFDLARRLVEQARGRTDRAVAAELMGELAVNREVQRALLSVAETELTRSEYGVLCPNVEALSAANIANMKSFDRKVDVIRALASSRLMVDLEDGLHGPELVRKGAAGDLAGILDIAREIAVNAFGGRQILYERSYLGHPSEAIARHFRLVERSGQSSKLVDELLRTAGSVQEVVQRPSTG
jgi:aromatic ring hydroxylase